MGSVFQLLDWLLTLNSPVRMEELPQSAQQVFRPHGAKIPSIDSFDFSPKWGLERGRPFTLKLQASLLPRPDDDIFLAPKTIWCQRQSHVLPGQSAWESG